MGETASILISPYGEPMSSRSRVFRSSSEFFASKDSSSLAANFNLFRAFQCLKVLALVMATFLSARICHAAISGGGDETVFGKFTLPKQQEKALDKAGREAQKRCSRDSPKHLQEDALGCYNFAIDLVQQAQDHEDANRALQRSCFLGYADACTAIAFTTPDGIQHPEMAWAALPSTEVTEPAPVKQHHSAAGFFNGITAVLGVVNDGLDAQIAQNDTRNAELNQQMQDQVAANDARRAQQQAAQQAALERQTDQQQAAARSVQIAANQPPPASSPAPSPGLLVGYATSSSASGSQENAGPFDPILNDCIGVFYKNDPVTGDHLILKNNCDERARIYFYASSQIHGAETLDPGEAGNTYAGHAEILAAGGVSIYACPENDVPRQADGSLAYNDVNNHFRCSRR